MTPSHRHRPRRAFRLAGAVCLSLGAAAAFAGQEPPDAAAPLELAAVAQSGFAAVDGARLEAADAEPGQWMSYGRTYSEQRYSPLRQIHDGNVAELGLAWYADYGTHTVQQSTPIVVDGVIYATEAWSKVNAYDARSGEHLWHFDPEVPGEWLPNLCCGVPNRGAAVWNGKVYVGTLDGRLIALDAQTGEVVWETQTTDPDQPYSITGAPRVVRGRVIIGQGGAEFLVRGYVSAYDAQTGELDWRWYTVPGNPQEGFENEAMERAAETWSGEWWRYGGGGTTWDAFTYDPVTGLLYVGVGNGSPWPRATRSPDGGDNLFLSSIVALDPEDGSYRWHYQTTPGDAWDYTATQQMIIADLEIDGEPRRVLMQAPKNGFFYLLDAHSGELISAEKFMPVNWALGIDENTGRPIENPHARYDETGEGFILMPGPGGANSWNPMSYNPDTGLVYLPARYNNFGIALGALDDNPLGQQLGISFSEGNELFAEQGVERINRGYLLAWDPVRQREAWRVPHGEGGRGSGTLSTAGNLVFQGNTANDELVAYSADYGRRLWSHDTQAGIVAAPVSFEVEGEQYVAVVVGATTPGFGVPNGSRLLVYRLGGQAQLPAPPEVPERRLDPPESTAAADSIDRGRQVYDRFCAACHGADGQSRGLFPDVRYSGTLWDQQSFDSVVLDGVMSQLGMPSFGDAMTPEDAAALRAYIIDEANRAVPSGQAGQ